jgi:hypothetical protein
MGPRTSLRAHTKPERNTEHRRLVHGVATVQRRRVPATVVFVDDDETQRVLRDVAGDEHAIPERLRGRLRGETIAELRKDAQVLARELGLVQEQPRDSSGKFASSMDELMRQGSHR